MAFICEHAECDLPVAEGSRFCQHDLEELRLLLASVADRALLSVSTLPTSRLKNRGINIIGDRGRSLHISRDQDENAHVEESASGAGATDPWSEVEKNERIAQSYLDEHHHGAKPEPPEIPEEWEPPRPPSAVWIKNWQAQLVWQLFYVGFAAIFLAVSLALIVNGGTSILVGVLFVAMGLLAGFVGIGSMLLPRRRAERFDDGTFVFSRDSKRLVVRSGDLYSLGYVYGGRVLGRPYPLSVESRHGNCTLAVLSNMGSLVNELRQQNPKAVLLDPRDWDS